MKCKTCKYSKWRRYLSETQSVRLAMANMLLDDHQPSADEKRRMMLKITSEFCKLKLVNLGDCSHYQRKWWRKKDANNETTRLAR